MINIIIDHDNDQIEVNGIDDLGSKISFTEDCKGMHMCKLQHIIYELINVISPTSVDINLSERNEGREVTIDSW